MPYLDVPCSAVLNFGVEKNSIDDPVRGDDGYASATSVVSVAETAAAIAPVT